MAEWDGKVVPSFKLVPDADRKEGSDRNVAQAVVAAIAEVPVVAVIAVVVEKAVGRVVSVEPIHDSE
jgi:hypothetical protein